MFSREVAAFSSAPIASNVSAISCASKRARALEQQVLDEVRDACAVGALVAGADADPEAERDGADARDPLGDDALAGVELAQDDLLHGPIVGERADALCARDEAQHGAVPLRVVQRLVGEAEQRLRVVRVLGTRRGAEARADVRGPGLTAGRQLLEQRLDPGDDLARVLLGRLREQQRELVAADAEGVVAASAATRRARSRTRRAPRRPQAWPKRSLSCLKPSRSATTRPKRAAVARRPRDLALEARRRTRAG